MKDKYGTDWSTSTCTCGYWVDDKYSGKKKHDEGCPCNVYDNTPNARGIIRAFRHVK